MIHFDELQYIFLDADDTLFRIRGTVGTAYEKHFRNYGLTVSAKEIDQVVPTAWIRLEKDYMNEHEEFRADRERDQLLWHRFISDLYSHFTDHPVPKGLLEELHGYFAKAESRILNSHAVDFISVCRDLQLETGILTNNDYRIHQLIPDLGLRDHFHHIFCASDIGHRKPSLKVFRGVEEKIGAQPQQMLYIGDCDRADYRGAKAAGWQAVWFNASGKSSQQVSAEIRCFRELIEVFQQQFSNTGVD